jgi:hypothetical protein
MTIENRPPSSVHQSGGVHPPGRRPRDIREMSRSVVARALRSFSSLVATFLTVAACAGLAAGHLSWRGCEKSAAQTEQENRRPARRDIQRYSARYIDAVEHALRERRDLLGNYATFREIWGEVSPDQPLLVQMISPAALDFKSREIVPAVVRLPVAIDANNFGEYRPLLSDLRTLILEGDGTGRGRLPATHFDTEPAQDWLPVPPAPRARRGTH